MIAKIIVGIAFVVLILIDVLMLVMYHDPVLFLMSLILTAVAAGLGALVLYAPLGVTHE